MTTGIKCPFCEKTTKPIDLSEHIKNEHGQKVWSKWVDGILEKASKSKNFSRSWNNTSKKN